MIISMIMMKTRVVKKLNYDNYDEDDDGWWRYWRWGRWREDCLKYDNILDDEEDTYGEEIMWLKYDDNGDEAQDEYYNNDINILNIYKIRKM